MTAAERPRKYRARRKADEQEIRNENLRLRRKSERVRSTSSLETEERQAVVIQRASAPCVLSRVMLAEQNQQLVHIESAVGYYPPGGRQNIRTFPGGTAWTPLFCYMCLFGHFSKRSMA
jgi:hypothetical protein